MIYYFSGTGNSLAVAKIIGERIGETLRCITKCVPYIQEAEGRSIGIVCPVYSWGIPPIVVDFIARLPERLAVEAKEKEMPVWVVLTYGDEAGNALRMLEKALCKRGLELKGSWGVTAPNTYVLLPGFDTDSAELETRKAEQLEKRAVEIAEKIKSREWSTEVYRGPWASLKTGVVYPLFKRWGINTTKWHSTDACIGCGRCAHICPVGNIAMAGEKMLAGEVVSGTGRPKWGTDCTSCCGCYHICPVGAVEYGSVTKGKGQKKRPLPF